MSIWDNVKMLQNYNYVIIILRIKGVLKKLN